MRKTTIALILLGLVLYAASSYLHGDAQFALVLTGSFLVMAACLYHVGVGAFADLREGIAYARRRARRSTASE